MTHDAKAVVSQAGAAAACLWIVLIAIGPSWLLRLMLISASAAVVLLVVIVLLQVDVNEKLRDTAEKKQIIRASDSARAQVRAATRARMEAISAIATVADRAQAEVADLHRKTVERAVDISETAGQRAYAANEREDEAIRRLADVNSEAATAIRGLARAAGRPLK